MATRTIDLSRFTTELGALQGKLIPTAQVALRTIVEDMIRDVVRNRMSGQYLGVVTGTARRSVTGKTERIGKDEVIAYFGSPLGYVRAHELGFEGDVQVKGHTRRLTKLSLRGGKLTKKGAEALKRRLRAGNKRFAYVRPHRRHVRMQARHFFRDSLFKAAGVPPYPKATSVANKRLGRAIAVLLKKGGVPTFAEVVGGKR